MYFVHTCQVSYRRRLRSLFLYLYGVFRAIIITPLCVDSHSTFHLLLFQFRLADAAEGLAGGTTLVNTGAQAYKTLFVGETENKGLGKKALIATDAAGGEKKMFYFDRSFPGIP